MLVMASLLAWSDNTVTVSYNGSTATVTVDDNVAQYLTVTQSGAHVSITQSSSVAEEITYTLTGTSSDGEFYMSGSYKATIELNGLTLTNTTPVYSGAAVHIQNSKRINVKVVTGTTNTLTDAASGSQKGCLYVKGHAEFKQYGTLNVVGNVSHGIKAGEYISVKNATINVTSAVDDGISCNQYFLMESGTVNISGTGDDGIQCDLDGDTSTGMTTDHEDEDSGNLYISGGNITISSNAIAAKGIKCQGDAYISGTAVINVTTTGKGEWDATDQETNAACGLSADGDINISGGTMTLTATGSGGKGMKSDNVINISGGNITVSTTGALYYNNGSTENTNYTGNTDQVNSNYYSSAKGIKAGYKEGSGNNTICYGGINISGGTLYVSTKGRNAEGIESKNYLNVTGGETTIDAYDDGINAAEDLYITDGYFYSRSSNNDGIDANGNVVIEGGLIYAIGAASPEVAIDANSEENKKFHFNGGVLIAIGGLESGSTLAQTCYQTSSVSSNTWYSMTYGGNVVAFLTPTISSGGGGFNPGGGGSSGLVVSAPSTPTLKSSVTVNTNTGTPVFYGPKCYLDATVTGGSNVSLSQYSSGGGGSSGSYQVTATANPTAGGSVTGAGTYTAHTLCTLTATANTGYTFVNWTRNGSVASTDPTYSFYVTETSTCVANFAISLPSYTITATAYPTAGGRVTGGGTYTQGTTATLTATANMGFAFTNWTKDGSVVSTNASYSFTVTENASYVANFTALPQYTITVVANPSEGGTVTGAGSYYEGTSATLTATANRGYAFVNWTKNGTQVSTNPTYTFTVTAAGNYVANFETATAHSVTCSEVEGGTISANVNTAYPGDIVTLTATANSGYFFSVWDVRDANNNTITVTDNQFTMPNSDVTVNASFVQGCTVTIVEVEHGTVTASATHAVPGTTITLTATPEADYFLSTWLVYQTGDVRNTVTVTNNTFELPAYDVTVVGIFKMTEEAEIAVGSGTGTTNGNCLPTTDYYKYSTTQQIYTAAEIGEAGTITAISFYYNTTTSSNPRNLQVYMSHTSAGTINTWVTCATSEMVYSGTVTFSQGWNVITLDTPFAYDGTSNLLLTVDDNTGQWTTNSTFYTYSTGANRAIYMKNDTYNQSPTSPNTGSNYAATSVKYNSQITFTIQLGTTSAGLVVTPNVLVGFTYVENEGPSSVQSVAVIGTDLTEDITVTASSDYEISSEENGTYGSTLTLTAESKGVRSTTTYDFEDGTSQGWTFLKGTGGDSPNNWMHCTDYTPRDYSSGYGHNSSNGFMLSESYISGTQSGTGTGVTPDNYLVSPQVELGGSITFWASNPNDDYGNEHFAVLVSTTSNTNVNSFTQVQEWTLLAKGTGNSRTIVNGTWYEYTADLSAFSGTGYIAIRHFDCYNQWLLCVDDITIENDDTPVTPTDPTTELLTANVYVRLKADLAQGIHNGTLTAATGDVTGNVSLNGEVTQPAQYTQTLELVEGWNWVSLYVEFDDPEQALLALEEALGEHGLKISSMDDYTTYEDEEWGAMGDLDELTNDQMYMVLVDEDIEVTLEGIPSNPADYTITILPNNWTWIGFPSAEAIAVEVAFADFEAEDGDKIQGVEDYTKYEDREWGAMGDLEELTPGQGYMYFSNSTQPKTLVIMTRAKAKAGSPRMERN